MANDPDPSARQGYEQTLTTWAEAGFTGPGSSGRREVESSVTWDAGQGCYRIVFQLGSEVHDFTEREFETFLMGVLAGSAYQRRWQRSPDAPPR